ncbi:MAG: hypothetical protein J7L96_01790 [Bacteroidales bacterium]|nr:hypothetical protein [Bacteroidales bacterium]
MKTKHLLLLFVLAGFTFFSCEISGILNPPDETQDLILSRGSGGKLILIDPANSEDLYVSDPSPAVPDVKSLKAGYMCKNAVFVSKNILADNTSSIFTSDAKTGANTIAITGGDLSVLDINVSWAESKIVFTGKPNDNPEYLSLYTINEDGSGLAHISEHLEHVTGLDGGTFEMQTTEYPVFSPDGSKIATDVLVVSYPSPDTFYDFILIMNNDGSNKEAVFSELGKSVKILDLCWTQDGDFLLFIILDNDDSFHRRIKSLNISSGKITDITSLLEVNGDQVNDISTSPNSNKLVFNQHLGGGSNLFIAEYEIKDDVLTIKGTPVKITDKSASGNKYYTPSWQVWDGNTLK